VAVLLSQIVGIYVWVLIARIVLTWIQVPHEHPVARVRIAAARLTDPVLIPLRGILPPLRLGAVNLDLAPLFLIVALRLLQEMLLNWIG